MVPSCCRSGAARPSPPACDDVHRRVFKGAAAVRHEDSVSHGVSHGSPRTLQCCTDRRERLTSAPSSAGVSVPLPSCPAGQHSMCGFRVQGLGRQHSGLVPFACHAQKQQPLGGGMAAYGAACTKCNRLLGLRWSHENLHRATGQLRRSVLFRLF